MFDLGGVLDLLMVVFLCVAILSGLPVLFMLTGSAALFGAIGWALGVFNPALMGALPSRVFGTMTSEVLTAIPLFVFMGIMLERSKIAEELLEAMGRLFGRVRGGLAISVTVVGALLAASTGIVGATVVTMGLMALPSMLRRGYDPAFACGTICAAGTLGQIIPPSTVMVIMGEVLSSAYQQAQFQQGKFSTVTVSVGELFAGSMLPGLCLAAIYAIYQLVVAWLRPEIAPAIPPADLGLEQLGAARVAGVLVPPIALIVCVLGSILGGVATPTEAAALGAVGASLMAGRRVDPGRPWPLALAAACAAGLVALRWGFDMRLGREAPSLVEQMATLAAGVLSLGLALALWRATWLLLRQGVMQQVMRSTMTITAMIFAMLIGAAMFSLVFVGLGGDAMVKGALESVPGGVYGAIFAVQLVIFVLGFFLEFPEITIIVIPLIGPILLGMGVDPIWFGVMTAVNLQTSFLSPPVGFSLFYLRSVAPPQVRTMDIYRGVIPYMGLQLIGLTLVIAFPALATWLPQRLFH